MDAIVCCLLTSAPFSPIFHLKHWWGGGRPLSGEGEGGGRFSLGSTVCLFNLHTVYSGIRTVSKHLELGCGVSKYFTWIWTPIQVLKYFTITNTIRFLLINLLYNNKNWIHIYLFIVLRFQTSYNNSIKEAGTPQQLNTNYSVPFTKYQYKYRKQK